MAHVDIGGALLFAVATIAVSAIITPRPKPPEFDVPPPTATAPAADPVASKDADVAKALDEAMRKHEQRRVDALVAEIKKTEIEIEEITLLLKQRVLLEKYRGP